ncbi:MAG: DUF2809 domain-containing protein [Paludibacter sp.]|nr:DUF2809 domain-containing protein [Paludibacter sp.]
MTIKRNRFYYLLFIVITIFSGLASRHYTGSLPTWVESYVGDALWALMVFLMAGFLFQSKSTRWIALVALVFSYCIEISQLYRAPWIDAVRANRLGGLVLGFGFLWSDLVCYAVGIGFGVVMEKIFLKK